MSDGSNLLGPRKAGRQKVQVASADVVPLRGTVDPVLQKILDDRMHYYVDEHGSEVDESPINWTWVAPWPALADVVLTALHQLCTSKRELRTHKSALGVQQMAKPFFVWLAQYDPTRKIGRERVLAPQVYLEFKDHLDKRTAAGEIKQKSAYQYKGAIARLLKQAWYGGEASNVLGQEWDEADFVADRFVDDFEQRPPYSMAEADRILREIARLLREWAGAESLPERDEENRLLAVYTGIALRLGIETECIDRLKLGDIELVGKDRSKVKVSYEKRRAPNTPNRRKLGSAAATGNDTVEKFDRVEDVGAFTTGGGLLVYARKLAQARGAAPEDDLWPKKFNAHDFDRFSGELHRRGLRDDEGALLAITRPRFRVSYKQARMIKSGGNLSVVADDHGPDVASRNYLENAPGLRPYFEHALVTAQSKALAHALNGPKVIPLPETASEDEIAAAAEEVGVPPEEVRRALSGVQDVWLASCRDFYNSPFAPAGSPCSKAFWGCFGCTNALVTRRTLPRVLRFLSFITEQRRILSSEDWENKFGVPYVQIIRDVLPKFPSAAVTEARRIAESIEGALHLPPELQAA